MLISRDDSNNNPWIQFSCCDAGLLFLAIASIVAGSLWIGGVFPEGMSGVILPGYSFGPLVEGGFCLAIGAIISGVVMGRIFSPNFRAFLDR